MAIKRRKGGLDVHNGEPIWWCDGKKPKRVSKTVTNAGIPVMEKVPQGPSREMITPQGNLINMGLTNGASDMNVRGPTPVRRMAVKLSKGFMPADECPMAAQTMPKDLMQKGDKPCQEWQDDRGFSKPRRGVPPCKHMQRIIAARRQQHEEATSRYANAFQTNQERMVEALLRREERELQAATEDTQQAQLEIPK